MNTIGGLWFCWGSEYPNKIGLEIYGGRHHPKGISLMLWVGYITIEWRTA